MEGKRSYDREKFKASQRALRKAVGTECMDTQKALERLNANMFWGALGIERPMRFRHLAGVADAPVVQADNLRD